MQIDNSTHLFQTGDRRDGDRQIATNITGFKKIMQSGQFVAVVVRLFCSMSFLATFDIRFWVVCVCDQGRGVRPAERGDLVARDAEIGRGVRQRATPTTRGGGGGGWEKCVPNNSKMTIDAVSNVERTTKTKRRLLVERGDLRAQRFAFHLAANRTPRDSIESCLEKWQSIRQQTTTTSSRIVAQESQTRTNDDIVVDRQQRTCFDASTSSTRAASVFVSSTSPATFVIDGGDDGDDDDDYDDGDDDGGNHRTNVFDVSGWRFVSRFESNNIYIYIYEKNIAKYRLTDALGVPLGAVLCRIDRFVRILRIRQNCTVRSE
jgi:hypothetical protein